MARSQFTFKFPNAQPGAPVTFSAAVYSSPADPTADGPTLALDSSRTVAVWTDAAELTATWVDGAGASIMAEASLARPIVTATGGVPGSAPTAASSALSSKRAASVTATGKSFVGAAGMDWTGGTVATAGDVFFSSGSALPLGMTVNGTGFAYPGDAANSTFTLHARATITFNAADVGEQSMLLLIGDAGTASTPFIVPASGLLTVYASLIDHVVSGETGGELFLSLDGALTHAAAVDAYLRVVEL